MSKYQLKITEYKLRGFCQIMEELGAIEIEIEFNNDPDRNEINFTLIYEIINLGVEDNLEIVIQ